MSEIIFLKRNKECFRIIKRNEKKYFDKYNPLKKRWENFEEFEEKTFVFDLKIILKIIKNGQEKRYGSTFREAEIEFFYDSNREVLVDLDVVKKFISKNFDHQIYQKNSENWFYGTYSLENISGLKYRYFSEEPYLD